MNYMKPIHIARIFYATATNFHSSCMTKEAYFFRELDIVYIYTCTLHFHFILLVINSTIQTAAQTKYYKMLGCQMNNVLKIMYTEAVFAKIEMPSQHFPRGTEKNQA